MSHTPANPRRLTPAQLVRILNSTPLGTVATRASVKRDRDDAGLLLDGPTIDLLRYTAWMAGQRHSQADGQSGQPNQKSEISKPSSSYDRHRDRMGRVQLNQSRSGRDIGPLPPVEDPDRLAACRLDFAQFCETYAAHVFTLAWSDIHRTAIDRIEKVVLQGDLFAIAIPRGWGKTSLCQWGVLWAVLYGHRKYAMYLGSTAKEANDRLGEIKIELDSNDVLFADFPEVCYPIRRLEAITQRARGQILDGRMTHMTWSDRRIILPTVDGSPASGVIIESAGLTAAIRGKKVTTHDNQVRRPDLVVPDDPQTDESARSPDQVAKRLHIINGTLLELAGPGTRIAALLPCTVIEPEDLADQLLDRKLNPQWQGQRTAALKSLPTNEIMWGEYEQVRRAGFDAEDDGEAANGFYRLHRVELEEGAKVVWPVNVKDGDVSALQSLMHIKIDRPETFWAEQMMQPVSRTELSDANLTREVLESRIVGPDFGIVPINLPRVTAFIDPNSKMLWWCACAWGEGFNGRLLDFAAWPDYPGDKPNRHPVHKNAKRTIGRKYKGISRSAQIYQALTDLVEQLVARRFPIETEPGQTVAAATIERIHIDAGWGEITDTVFQFCRESKYSALLRPTFGRFVGPNDAVISEWSRKPGDRVGHHWRERSGHRASRFLIFDTNAWKSIVAAGFHATHPEPGSITLATLPASDGNPLRFYRTFFDHMMAETAASKEGKHRHVDIFTQRDGVDNDWFDGMVGCAVAASCMGITALGHQPKKQKRKRRVSYGHAA